MTTVAEHWGLQFNPEFDAALADLTRQSGQPLPEWMLAGMQKPEGQVENWRTLGPRVVGNFIDWWEAGSLKVWVTPDSQAAIELELNVQFGSIPVLMYVDLVATDDGQLEVLDLKSGSKVPSDQQLGFYACGLELAYGREYRPKTGRYFMARGMGKNKDVFLTEPIDLSLPQYSVAYYTAQLEAMERGRQQKAFVANRGDHCRRCDVSQYCTANGGSYAALADPHHPAFVPF